MPEGTSQTQLIQVWIDRLRSGDDSARSALIECACERLTLLTRKMLRQFPGVKRWEQTDDALVSGAHPGRGGRDPADQHPDHQAALAGGALETPRRAAR
jgi:hypothetical protein